MWAAFILIFLSGCATQPWVKPFDREYINHPLMQVIKNPADTRFTHHVRETREAARGAVPLTGGSCGCY